MKNTQQILLGMLILFVFLLGGCAQNTEALPKDRSEPEPASSTAETGVEEDNTPKDSMPESNAGENHTAANTPADSTPAPQIEFECIDLDGNTVTAEVFAQSKLTMVNVWATYCNPCLNEMPGLGELAAEYDPEEFQIIGIVSDVLEGDDQSLAESLVQQTDAAYPHLLLNRSVYTALLTDIVAVPTTFFIDENGEVLDTVVGAMNKTAWEDAIDALLEQSGQ